jgi:hypothetical protein
MDDPLKILLQIGAQKHIQFLETERRMLAHQRAKFFILPSNKRAL